MPTVKSHAGMKKAHGKPHRMHVEFGENGGASVTHHRKAPDGSSSVHGPMMFGPGKVAQLMKHVKDVSSEAMGGTAAGDQMTANTAGGESMGEGAPVAQLGE